MKNPKFFAAIALIAALIALPVAAAATDEWIDYTDGDSTYGYDPFNNADDLWTMRFSPQTPIRIKLIMFYTEYDGVVELHLYKDDNDFPNLDREMMAPVEVEVREGFHRYSVDFSDAPIVVDPALDFHVGILKKDDGPRLAMDSTTNWGLRAKSYRDGVWHENKRDWFISLKVERFNIPTETQFTDVTENAGLTTLGSRVAWADYDNDGDLDLMTGNHLYANDGDGTFTEVSEAAGITEMPNTGAVWADFNNDGCIDYFAMANSLEVYDRFVQNNCDGTFTDITDAALYEEGVRDDRDLLPTEGAGWGDYNKDGFLDLYIANYEMPGDTLSIGTRDKLYRNNGDGTFTDVAPELGLDPVIEGDGDYRCGRGVNWADYNDDGWPDIYVSNYRLDPNFLYKNDSHGNFTEVSGELGVQGYEFQDAWGHTIGSTWADFNNDGYLDLLNANLAHPRFFSFSDPSFIFINNGPPNFDFTDMTEQWKLIFIETNSDPSAGDWNNDGWCDLMITNIYTGYQEQLYRNDGIGRFSEMGDFNGLKIDNGWGSTFVDYDADGDLDMMCNKGLFQNNGTDNNWLQVKLECNDGDPNCVGARIEVQITNDKGPQAKEISSGKGTTNGNPFILHFGLNQCQTAWRVTAKFLNGKTVTLYKLPANVLVTINEDDASDDEPASPLEPGACSDVDYPKPTWPAGGDWTPDDDADDDTNDDDTDDDVDDDMNDDTNDDIADDDIAPDADDNDNDDDNDKGACCG